MGTVTIVVIGGAVGLAVIAVCVWFVFTLLKTLVVIPLQYIGNARGPATVSIDQRIAGPNPYIGELTYASVSFRCSSLATFRPRLGM